jgi:hypothetical protein
LKRENEIGREKMKQQNEERSGGAKRRECGRKGVTDDERCTV